MGRFLIVSYNYGPTLEVGARRVGSIADHLVATGHAVDIIFWPDQPFMKSSGQSLPSRLGLTLFPIQDPRGATIRRLVNCKQIVRRAFKRLFGRNGANGHANGVAAGAGGTDEASWFGRVLDWLRNRVAGLIFLLDGRKRWAYRAARCGVRLAREQHYDCVLSSGPPNVSCVVATWIGARSGVPSVIDLRDPWNTNSLVPTRAPFPLWLDEVAERWCMRRAALLTFASPGILRRVSARFPAYVSKMHVVLNGFDPEDCLTAPAPTGRMNLLYAGSLYLNRNPFPLLESLARLIAAGRIDRQLVSFTFVGDCGSWSGVEVRPWCANIGLNDVVQILPPVSRAELRRYKESANVLVNFAQGQADQIPAKTYEMIAAARQLLVLTEPNSDTATILRAAQLRGVVSGQDPADLDDAILAIYETVVLKPTPGIAASPTMAEFSRERQNAAWGELLARASVPARVARPLENEASHG